MSMQAQSAFLPLALIALMHVNIGITFPIIPSIMHNNQIHGFYFAIPFMSMVLARVFIRSFITRLLKKFGNKAVLSHSFTAYCSIFLLYPHISSVEGFTAIRIIEGLIEGCLSVILVNASINASNTNSAGKSMGALSATMALGLFIGILTGTCLGLWVDDIKNIFYVGAPFSLLGIALIWQSSMSSYPKVDDSTNDHNFIELMYLLKKQVSLLLCYIPFILQKSITHAFMILIPLHTQTILGFTYAQTGWLLGINIVLAILLLPIFGKLADQVNPKAPALIGLSIMTASLIGMGTAQNAITFTGMYILNTVSFSCLLPAGSKFFAIRLNKSSNSTNIIASFSNFTEVILLVLSALIPILHYFMPLAAWIALSLICVLALLLFMRVPNLQQDI